MATDRNYLFVSDLHLSEGRDPITGLLSRNEDFFQDDVFARFLAYHVNLGVSADTAVYYHKPWTLVINGDIFDFLQVVTLPAEGDELFSVKGVRSYDELSGNERNYGLGTRSPEIVWKMRKVAAGHPRFMQALAWFVAHEGNELVLMKGNHDIEIYWPAVQQTIRDLLVTAYADWQNETAVPGTITPLPRHADMPAQLDLDHLQTAVTFPPHYLHVPDLFFAEHGCQYDPVNSFTDFAQPTLPNAEELIELPSGSFFVRYFFNKVEVIHPFADNIKPILKYASWVVRNAPNAVIRFLVDLLPRYLRALAKLRLKLFKDWWRSLRGNVRDPYTASPESVSGRFLNDLLNIQANTRAEMKKNSRIAGAGTFGGLLFSIGTGVLLLIAIRQFVNANYGQMAFYFGLAFLAGFFGSMMTRLIDTLLASNFLFNAANRVCSILNEAGEMSSVRFFIYGHDHQANVQQLTPKTKLAFRQWYVNTGAWIPVFSEEDRLLREDEQLTFLRLLPDHPHFTELPPELLQWDHDAEKPRQVRLFAE